MICELGINLKTEPGRQEDVLYQHHEKLLNPYDAGDWFGQYKMMQRTWKMTETLAYGYSSESAQLELSDEYQHVTVFMVIKIVCTLVL